MGTTSLLSLPYPESSDPPNGAAQIQALAEAVDGAIAYVGQIRMMANNVTPTGWVACNGQALSRTTYADLFAAIGISFGGGDGSTTFNVPDLRGRVPMGGGTVGDEGGADSDSITLTVGNLPSHNHSIAHNHPAATTSSDTHSHGYRAARADGNQYGTIRAADTNDPSAEDTASYTEADSHTHTFDVPSYSGNSGNTGSDAAFTVDTVPSHVRIGFIIFAGV